MKLRKIILPVLVCICLFVCCLAALPAYSCEVRESIASGSFYPSSPVELRRLIEDLAAAAGKDVLRIPPGDRLRAIIVPHAGYIYSGRCAAYASSLLKGGHFSKVIVMGPDHRVGFNNACISDVDAYKTPLGRVAVHEDAGMLRDAYDIFQAIPASDRYEHSIEVVLPFLQYCLGEFPFIPIVMGPGDISSYAAAVGSVVDNDTLLVVSSDLSHYLPYDQAATRDRETIDMIVQGRADELLRDENRACGAVPILVVMTIARERGWKAMLLNYTNSGDTAGARSSVVGYAAIAFYGGPMQKSFSEKQGQLLVKLARNTIQEHLGMQSEDTGTIARKLSEDVFQERRGVFVTLNRKGRLRGCIGSLEGRESVLEGVKHNAVNAAFHDPRFSPVGRTEMADMDIEVSILSEPRPLEYSDYKDLLAKLRPGIDGVIIRQGYASATFLPQVWDQLPGKEEFLDHLCAKAGLGAQAWKQGTLEVLTYQVQYFEEAR